MDTGAKKEMETGARCTAGKSVKVLVNGRKDPVER
jgi:hypothetical protein